MVEPKSSRAWRTIHERRKQYEDELRKASASPIVGLPTGIPKLDERLSNGLRGCTVLTAPPGTGKTSLATDVARHAAEAVGRSVLFVSAEMSVRALTDMLFANVTGMKRDDVERGAPVLPENKEVLDRWYAWSSTAGKHYATVGGSEMCAADVISAARDLKGPDGPGPLIVIDGLQPFAARERARDDGEREVIERVMAQFSGAADELGASFLLISHMTKASLGADGKGRGAFFGSVSIEFMSDLAIVMSPPPDAIRAGKDRYDVTLRLTKNRHGRIFSIKLCFDGASCRFEPEARSKP